MDTATIQWIISLALCIIAWFFPNLAFFSNISQGLFFEETLPMNVQTTDISGGYEGIDKKIKVGDLVRKVN